MLALRRPVLLCLPSSPYLMALAMVDPLALWTGLVPWWLNRAYGVSLWNMNRQIRMALIFLVYFLTCMSGGIVTSISVQRMISVCFQLKAKIWNSRRNIYCTLAVLAFVLFLLDIPLIHFCENLEDYNLCVKFGSLIDFTVWFCLPFMIISASSIAIIVKLRKLQKFRNRHNIRGNNADKRITTVLLIICLLYVIFISPWCLLSLLPAFQIISIDLLLLVSCITLSYMSNATNFIVYFFAAPNFRKEIRQMIHCKRAT